MTLNLDLTELLKELKKRDLKLYPTMIYLLSMIVNKHEEFCTAIDKDARVGIYDFLHPSYTIFRDTSETFTNIWTEYTSSFPEFYKRYMADVREYGTIKRFLGKPGEPSNIFTISSIP